MINDFGNSDTMRIPDDIIQKVIGYRGRLATMAHTSPSAATSGYDHRRQSLHGDQERYTPVPSSASAQPSHGTSLRFNVGDQPPRAAVPSSSNRSAGLRHSPFEVRDKRFEALGGDQQPRAAVPLVSTPPQGSGTILPFRGYKSVSDDQVRSTLSSSHEQEVISDDEYSTSRPWRLPSRLPLLVSGSCSDRQKPTETGEFEKHGRSKQSRAGCRAAYQRGPNQGKLPTSTGVPNGKKQDRGKTPTSVKRGVPSSPTHGGALSYVLAPVKGRKRPRGDPEGLARSLCDKRSNFSGPD